MEITDIRMNLLDNAGGVKAIGSFSLDNAFAVRGMRVMEDKRGRNFVAFPSRERANGDYEDIAFPLSKEFYHEITDAIIKEFNRKKEELATQDKQESKDESKDKSASEDESKSQEQAQTESAGKSRKGRGR